MNTQYRTEMRKYRFLNNEMTQQQLGKLMGLSRASVCEIETGKRIPTLHQAHFIAKILNTTIDVLFFPEEQNSSK